MISTLFVKKKYIQIKHSIGACHADDLSYLFRNALVDRIEPKSLELKTIQRMVILTSVSYVKYI